ncbi:hypothetical protein [Dendrosporobacter sp. 1207_IL3150]|uniref:hypothetical protein n=1 Tax=Dendrosporobacter sp. 1207_IL3150 TaxID=3084054 RepID=UPI002FDA3CE2
MQNIRFENKQLIVDEETIDFSHKIKDIKLYENLILILFIVPKGEINNQNVCAVDMNNKSIVWRIQEPDFIYDDSPYTNFEDLSEGIVIGNWNGISYEINKKDGSRIRGIQTK